MANPVFTNYNYKYTNYRLSTGEISDIAVSGDVGVPLTVTWSGPNGYTSGPYDGSTTHTLTSLDKGTYTGTVTDDNGLTGTTTVTIQEKGRLYLSVTNSTTTVDCEASIDVTAFQHNGLGLDYTLTNLETSGTQSYTGGTGEAHSFTNLCNGSYRLVATETLEPQYNMNGSSVNVASTRSYTYETYILNVTESSGNCENTSQFVSEDYFESTGSTTESFLEFYTGNNGSIDGLFDVSNIIIKAPKSLDGTTNCDDASLRINVKKLSSDGGTNTCDYVSFTLDANGKVLFTHSDGTTDFNITQECCSSLGFTPELSEFGVYNCRWQEVATDPCQTYLITSNTDNSGNIIFVNGDTGEYTSIVPTAECCTKEGLVSTQNSSGYSCTEPVQEPSCEGYTFSGTFDKNTNPEERYAIFYVDGGTTNSVPTAECCTVNGLESKLVDGSVRCYEAVPDCSGYIIKGTTKGGYVLFEDTSGTLVTEVYNSECCTDNGYVFETNTSTGTFKCKEEVTELDLPILEYVDRVEDSQGCTDLTMRIIGVPDTWVKFRVTLIRNSEYGYVNEMINSDTGQSITPVTPAGGAGSYCEGSVYIDSSGVTNLIMNTCVNPPTRNFTDSCVELKYEIYDYDNTTIKPTNFQYTSACYL